MDGDRRAFGEGDLEVLLEHKRELFDAMVAYHHSEIAHTNHTIALIAALLTATTVAYGGLLAKSAPLSTTILIALSLGFLFSATLGTIIIVKPMLLKIEGDHNSWMYFRTEYQECIKTLRIADRLPGGSMLVIESDEERERLSPGYQITKQALARGAVIVPIAALVGTALTLATALSRT